MSEEAPNASNCKGRRTNETTDSISCFSFDVVIVPSKLLRQFAFLQTYCSVFLLAGLGSNSTVLSRNVEVIWEKVEEIVFYRNPQISYFVLVSLQDFQ